MSSSQSLLVADQEAAGWSAWTPEMPLLPGAPLQQGKPRTEPQRESFCSWRGRAAGVSQGETDRHLSPLRPQGVTETQFPLSASRALPSPGPFRDPGLRGALGHHLPRLWIEFLWRWPGGGGNPADPQAPFSSAFSPYIIFSLGWQGWSGSADVPRPPPRPALQRVQRGAQPPSSPSLPWDRGTCPAWVRCPGLY